MPWLLGVDEAGYGPNLGPLVISASLWRVPGNPRECDLYEQLADAVCDAPSERCDRLPVADSKVLYKSGGGVGHLECGVQAALATLGRMARTWRVLWQTLCSAAPEPLAQLPWYASFDRALPKETNGDEIAVHAERLKKCLKKKKVELCALRSVVLFPSQLNELIDRDGSKGLALSRTSLGLVAAMVNEFSCHGEPLFVLCDKHGGRNKYGPLLQEFFPDPLVEVHGESTGESVYRWGPRPARTEVVFRAKGDRFFPTALASMACKYLRELAMEAENAFWLSHVPGLKPTAGYPEDAGRFKIDIAAAQARLGILDHELWRKR